MPRPIFEIRKLAVAIYEPGTAERRRGGEITVEPYGPVLPAGWVEVITDFSLAVHPGEVVAIVGESGSGKTLAAMGSLGLLAAEAKVIRGEVYFNGTRIRPTGDQERRETQRRLHLRRRRKERLMEELYDEDWRRIMGTEVGLLFQDAIGSWNPIDIIGRQAGEALEEHTELSLSEIRERVLTALGEVKLPKQSKYAAFPNELSRGQAQRAMLAAALAKGPRLLVADEPLTGLDAAVGSAVLSLIRDMQRKRGMAMLFVTHDLAQVASVATRVVIMYGGRIVETGPVDTVFHSPQHPYTAGLLGALPQPGVSRLHPIPGDVVKITDVSEIECPLVPRCEHAVAKCSEEAPRLVLRPPGAVACWRADELRLHGI